MEWEALKEVSVLKVRVKFQKNGAMKFVGHLDIMRYFQKALRRAGIPYALSGGYSPHIIMSFAHPLGVGLTSDGEYFDIEITESMKSEEAVSKLNEVMVEGMHVLSFVEIPPEKKSKGMSVVSAADYRCAFHNKDIDFDFKKIGEDFFGQPNIEIVKKTKRSEALVDIKPMIYDFKYDNNVFTMQVASGSAENLKPGLVMEAFCEYAGINPIEHPFSCHRTEIYARTEEGLKTLEQLGKEII